MCIEIRRMAYGGNVGTQRAFGRTERPICLELGRYGTLHISQLAKAMRAGVSTLVDRSDGIEAVADAVRNPNVAVTRLPRPRHDNDHETALTVRECEVLELIGTGSTSLETSRSLG